MPRGSTCRPVEKLLAEAPGLAHAGQLGAVLTHSLPLSGLPGPGTAYSSKVVLLFVTLAWGFVCALVMRCFATLHNVLWEQVEGV